MANTQETIADIIAEMRRRIAVKISDAWYTQEEWRKLCDRLEAAWKRERAKIEAEVGNAAKLREAVKAVVDVGYPHNFQHEAPHISGYCYDITRAIGKCFAALSAPPRNCDRFATETDAQIAFLKEERQIGVGNLGHYPLDRWENWTNEMKSAYSKWLFAPATEKEGGAK